LSIVYFRIARFLKLRTGPLSIFFNHSGIQQGPQQAFYWQTGRPGRGKCAGLDGKGDLIKFLLDWQADFATMKTCCPWLKLLCPAYRNQPLGGNINPFIGL